MDRLQSCSKILDEDGSGWQYLIQLIFILKSYTIKAPVFNAMRLFFLRHGHSGQILLSKLLQPSLMIARKARSLPKSGAPFSAPGLV
jgi:hypothetical protein